MRVDGFSKIIASVLPASGLSRPSRPFLLVRRRRGRGCRRSVAGVDSRTGRGSAAAHTRARLRASVGAGPVEDRRSPRRRRSRSMISGGRRRTTLSPAGTRSSPFSSSAAMTSASARWSAGRASGRRRGPRSRCRDASWRGSPAGRAASLPMRSTRGRKPGANSTSSTALPAAMASGLPPKVEPCVPVVMPTAAFSVARQAPTREAAADALGDRRRCPASRRPIHGRRTCRCGPTPDWISSKNSSRPNSSQMARTARIVLEVQCLMPPSPCTGSTQDGRRSRSVMAPLQGVQVAERHLVEAIEAAARSP